MYSQEDKSISVIAKTGDVILYTSEGFKDLTPPPTPPPKVEEKPEPKPEPKQEVIVKDTVVTEEVKDTVVAEEPEQPRGKFLLHTFIEHLKNTHPEKDKFKTKRGLKYNKKDTVKVTIAASLSTILKQLEEQYNIEYSEDCEDCYEIIGISPKE